MSTYGRRTHLWDYLSHKCKRCGLTRDEAREGPLNRIGNCSVPRSVPWTRIKKEKVATWREAAEIAEAHGRVELAEHYRGLAQKEE